MYRYRAIASFHIWDAICRTAMDASCKLLKERGAADRIANFDLFWADFHCFVGLQHATGRTDEEILGSARAVLNYDFPAWLAEGDVTNPEPYRLPEPRWFVFELTNEGFQEMKSALAVWTNHIRGLSKLVTRIKVESQIRTCRPAERLDIIPPHIAASAQAFEHAESLM